ncbi:hypothetical protein [Burkholderia alba]|uniref:hypothetical protein n=1 Tax=Burkholderia alba TaxID=2683677 RepID=UPI002B05D8B1|nr:hypothetical protein [Burkholderia alba]
MLTGYWAFKGNGPMLAVSAACLAAAGVLWGWRVRRRAFALPAGLFAPPERHIGRPLFGLAWAAVLMLGLHAYGQGFTPAQPLYPLIVAAGLLWTAAGLLTMRFSAHALESARQLRRVLLLLGLVFATCGVATGYGFGWAYTLHYGDETIRSRSVVAKWVPLRQYGCAAYVDFDHGAALAPPHCVSSPYWSRLAVGSTVRTRQRESAWGSIVNVVEARGR